MYGHVNNGVHLTLFEDARVNFYLQEDENGRRFDDLIGADNFVLVGRQEIVYRKQLSVSPEPLMVHLWVSRIGGSSFDLAYELTDVGSYVVYAHAVSALVQASRGSGRSVPLTAEQTSFLSRFYHAAPSDLVPKGGVA